MTRRFDNARHTAYNTANPARGHRVRPGERRAVHTKAVSHFPAKGGEACGKRTLDESSPIPDMLHPGLSDLDVHIPKSSLAARLGPGRLTFC